MEDVLNQSISNLTELVADICGVAFAAISIYNKGRSELLSGCETTDLNLQTDRLLNIINGEINLIKADPFADKVKFRKTGTEGFFLATVCITKADEKTVHGAMHLLHTEEKALTEPQTRQLQKLCGQASNLIKARNSNTALVDKVEHLLKIEEIFNLSQKANKIGAWELDVDYGRMIWTSEVYAIHDLPESHQNTLQEGINFYHPADRPKITQAIQRTIADGTPHELDCRLISAKGRLKWVRITGRPFENKRNRKVIIGSIQDISEKKKAELIRRQEYGFFDSGPVSILMFGIAENWPITYATENVYSLLGYRPEELKDGRFRYLELIHPDDALVFENFAYELLENHDTEPDITYRFKTATGGYKWIRGISRLIQDSDGVPVAIRAYISDNTIQKESELRLEENEKLLNSFFNQSFTGFFFAMLDEPVKWDDEADKEALLDYVMTHQRITKVNQAMLDQYGATEEQFLGLTPSDLFAHDIKHGRYIWRGLFDKGKWHVETREQKLDGTPIIIDGDYICLYDSEGRITGHFGVQADVTAQKEAAGKLEAQRWLYEQILEQTMAGYWDWYVKENTEYLSHGFKKMFGYEDHEIENTPDAWQEIIFEEDLEKVFRVYEDHISSRGESPYYAEVRYHHKDGSTVWVICTGKVIEWDEDWQPVRIVGAHVNITKLKEQQQKLTYQQNLLGALFKLSPIGIALTDFETGSFIDANEKLIEYSGFSKDELLSLTNQDITPPEFATNEARINTVLEKRGFFGPYEKEFFRKDGSRYPVQMRGKLIEDLKGRSLVWSFIEDISERKAQQLELEEALANQRATLDASTQVGIVAANNSGTITWVNSGAERMLGYTETELVNHASPALFHVQEEIEARALALSEQYGETVEGFETLVFKARKGMAESNQWTIKRKDSSIFPSIVSVTAIHRQDEIIGFLGVLTDISEQKKTESEMRSLLQITESQNERLKNFAHIASHNLRSHAVGISGLLELWQEKEPGIFDEEIPQMLLKAAENLDDTIEDLTEVVKINLSDSFFEKLPLKKLLKKNIDSVSVQTRRSGLTINTDVPDDLMVQGNPAYLNSVLLNLITNAAKYSSPERESYLTIKASAKNGYACISFEDNGLGIDLKRHGHKIFGMYKTFHKHPDSRGVGLFLAKSQLENMGGTIRVESEAGKGTTFTINLPLAE